MLDYQRLVEEIQAAIHSQANLDWDLLRDASAEYAAACDEVNTRLERCTKLLRQGLRSEAIQLADQEPLLLDSAAVLDFPELPEWVQILTINGMVPPPAIRIDAASDLNQAYATEAPLLSLLKRHRLLALARAPLPLRIQTLRAISQADAATTIWSTDLAILESARLQEISREVDQFVSRRDLQAINQVCQEVASSPWLVPPRPELVQQLTGQQSRLAAILAREQLEAIEVQLSNSYTAFDVAAGKQARQQWLQLLPAAQLTPSDRLAQLAAPALAWLAEQDRRDERERQYAIAVANLEDALEQQRDRATLERLFHTLERTEEKPPELLARRYYEQIRQFETVGRRRFVVMATAVVLALLLVASGVGWVAMGVSHHQRVLTTARQLQQLIESSQWEQASSLFAALEASDPTVASASEVQSQVVRLRELEQIESDRRAAFLGYLQRARDSFPDRPDRVALSEALKVAVGVAEKSEVAKLDSQFMSHERSLQSTRDEKFERDYLSLLRRVEATEDLLAQPQSQPLLQSEDDLAQLLAEATALSKRAGGVTAVLVAQVEPLKLRLTSLQKQFFEQKQQSVLLAELIERIGQPETYSQKLVEFAEKFPTSILADEFQRVSQESDFWKSHDAWSAIIADPKLRDLQKIEPLDAKRLLARLEQLREEAEVSPLRESLEQKQPYLQAIVARLDDEGAPRTKELQKLFRDVFLTGLWHVETKSRERYYLLKDFEIFLLKATDSVPVEYVVSFDLQTIGKRIPKADIATYGKAPQSNLASLAELNLPLADDGKWELGMYRIIQGIVADTQTDPLLRFILLQRVLDVALAGSHPMQVGFVSTQQQVEQANVDITANWLLPTDVDAVAARAKAQAVLASLVDLSKQVTKARETLDLDVAPLRAAPQWIAILLPGSAGTWICRGPKLDREGTLFVMDPESSASRDGFFQPVGRLTKSGLQDLVASPTALLAGRPLFFVPDAPAKEDSSAPTTVAAPAAPSGSASRAP